MYNIILENEDGDQLTFNHIGGDFQIIDVDGLYPPTATINTNQTALVDGATFNSSKVDMRTMNIAFSIEQNAEKNRIEVYKVLRVKRPVKFYYKSEMRDVFINGYVESVTVDHFAQKQTVTLSMLCPFPYFKNAEEVVNEMSAIASMFHFPFHSTSTPQIVFGSYDPNAVIYVPNLGMLETGITFELYAKDAISNPKIYNYQTQEFFGLDFDMVAGDQITISTGQGEKWVRLLREGVETNIFNYISEGSTWLQLPAGGAAFVYTIDSGMMSQLVIQIKHYDIYEGV